MAARCLRVSEPRARAAASRSSTGLNTSCSGPSPTVRASLTRVRRYWLRKRFMAVRCRYPAGSSITATLSQRSNTLVNASCARSSASALLPVMNDRARRSRSFCSSKNDSNAGGSVYIASSRAPVDRRSATSPISHSQHPRGTQPVGKSAGLRGWSPAPWGSIPPPPRPTEGAAERPGDDNHGVIGSLSEFLEALEGIVERAVQEEDRLGYFAALYRKVTSKAAEGIRDGFFDDGPRMERLAVGFANRYLTAMERFRAGEPATRSWQVSFEAARTWRPLIVQHLLLG